MTIPKLGLDRRHLKYGEKTVTFSVKLPPSTIEEIRKRRYDVGQLLYDIVTKNLDPYNKDSPQLGFVVELTKKLVGIFIAMGISTEGTGVSFDHNEISLITEIAKEITKND